MSKPLEQLNEIDHIINWMGLNGHLKDDDAQKAVNDISKAVHKARQVFEKLQGAPLSQNHRTEPEQ